MVQLFENRMVSIFFTKTSKTWFQPFFWALMAAGVWAVVESPVLGQDQKVVVLVDDSGSMNDSMRTDQGRIDRIEAAKVALDQVIDMLPEATTELGVLLLNGESQNNHWLVDLAPLNKETAKRQVQQLRANGGTPLGATIEIGMNKLIALREKQKYGTYRLLVVTDGEATDESYMRRVLPDALSRGILFDVIGVDMQSDHSLAKFAHSYRRADDAAAFQEALVEVLAESGGQDDGVGDFEMLEGLPSEVAAGVLKSLSSPKNGPLRTNNRPGVNISFSSGGGSGVESILILPGFCCFGFLAVAIVVMVKISKGKRRR